MKTLARFAVRAFLEGGTRTATPSPVLTGADLNRLRLWRRAYRIDPWAAMWLIRLRAAARRGEVGGADDGMGG